MCTDIAHSLVCNTASSRDRCREFCPVTVEISFQDDVVFLLRRRKVGKENPLLGVQHSTKHQQAKESTTN